MTTENNQAVSQHVSRERRPRGARGRNIHVQMATITGGSGHFARRDHRKRVGAKSNVGTEPKSDLYTSGEPFRWNESQGLDAVKIGCGKKNGGLGTS